MVGISLPLLDWRFGLDRAPALSENRVPAPAPTWPRSLAEWQALPRALEAYWNDAFGFRRRLIRWNGILNYEFGVSPTAAVVIGKRSQLFYAGDRCFEQHRGLAPFSAAELDNWAEQLEARRAWLARRGAHFLFLITPDKQSVYPDDVQERYGPLTTSPVDQLIERLRGSRVVVLDLRARERAARADGPVFLLTDSHWNDHGAYVGYAAVVERLQDWYPFMRAREPSSFARHISAPWNGDLSLMFPGVYDTLKQPSEQWSPVPPPTTRLLPSDGYVPAGSHRYEVYAGPQPSWPRAVFFIDSFLLERGGGPVPERAAAPPTPSFRPQLLYGELFSRAAFSWQYDFDAATVEHEQPDVVIEEHTERFIRQGPIGGVPSE
jgi:hypothetical protein